MLRPTLSAFAALTLFAGTAQAQLRTVDQSIFGMD